MVSSPGKKAGEGNTEKKLRILLRRDYSFKMVVCGIFHVKFSRKMKITN